MNVTDIADDGSVFTCIYNSSLMIYDVFKNKLLHSLIEKPETTKTKILKISPMKTAVAWLKSVPNQLSVIHINSKSASNISASTDYSFEYILWCPHGEYLTVFSSLSIFTDVYSVGDNKVEHITKISGAKFDDLGCPIAQFSPDGEYFASVNIFNNGHSISVYCITNSSWIHVQMIKVTDCLAVGGALWCQDSASLLVWEGCAAADLSLRLVTVDGRVEQSLRADAAPITTVSLSGCGRMAALHSSDARVRILDLLTWQLGSMGVLVHCPIVHESSARSRLREMADQELISVCEPIAPTLCELNHDESRARHLRLLRFSSDVRYLATYDPIFPNTLWLWDLTSKLPLDTIIKLADNSYVLGLQWQDDKALLAVTLSNSRVLVWTPQQSVIINHWDKPFCLTAETYLATLL
uniref:WD repeat-containing protein WRAP73 n=1 Tax=Graphocephala atropunctata TaxID=36148 RepID=A0A1B6MD87_9HEMI